MECDERFEAIFGLSSAASKVIDSNLTILKVNHALTELMGYSAGELIGNQIMAYACEEDKRHWQELQAAMWQQGKPNFKLDARLWTKDKALIWVHVTTVTFKKNGVTYAHTVLDDFTAWKKLQESDERLSMALAYSKMAVWELNRRDRSITCSKDFDHLFGDMHAGSWNEEMLVGLFFPEDQ